MSPRIKICCIAGIEEARLAVDCGADVLGLVSAMPSGPGVVDEATIAAVAGWAPPGVATFLLTCLRDAEAIAAQHARCRTTAIQLCDRLPPGAHVELRGILPGIKLIQVVHVADEDAVAEAVEAAPLVDAILLDSGNQKIAVKELGGTGRVHDWRLSRRIRDAIAPTPLFLAGGLSPENAAEAVRAVDPFGLDICSGVRSGGKLDAQKLRAFMSAASG